jgi:ribulose kinase
VSPCLDKCDKCSVDHLAVLQELLEKLRVEEKVESLAELTKDLHIYPDFHGEDIERRGDPIDHGRC